MRVQFRPSEIVQSAAVVVFMLFVAGVILRAAVRWIPGADRPIRAVTSRADLGGV